MAWSPCALAAAWEQPVYSKTFKGEESGKAMNEILSKASQNRIPGGGFLLHDPAPSEIFTLEDMTDEHRQTAAMASSFAERSIIPVFKRIEDKEPGLVAGLIREAGELGLLGADVPEEFGGVGLDKVTSAIIADRISVSGSFYVAFSAHVGIGTLPLLWYGTADQKEQYLSKLASGEMIAAYALSEASSGSDAINIRTRATLSEDGSHYLLNGEKMWISNAGIADLFTVFAKVDGKHFSAFLVEAGFPGLSIGPEEHKMGIRGSSTCSVILSDCKVPAKNLLGEVGKGHQIAFNILNVGRYKLGATCLGAARTAFRNALRYGKQRSAFGKVITDFGLIQEKLSACAADIYAGEALVYRVVGSIDAALREVDESAQDVTKQIQKRIEEHVIECSIVKVWCSEMLERVVDHALQIYGGYGFTEDYPAARSYCDSRVNKIFEGTNEINRLLITGWTLKRASHGESGLFSEGIRAMKNTRQAFPNTSVKLGAERAFLANAKELTLYCLGVAYQEYSQNLHEEQEIAGALSDLMTEVYVLESALLRAEKASSQLSADLVGYYVAGTRQKVIATAERVLAAASDPRNMEIHAETVGRLTRGLPANSIAISRRIAKALIEAGQYQV
jgi:alkylation response protein AidB-like acyl-CoA dehydrogenase